jgi:long-subunit acyl-CoA synthetase (AMP-forming)
VLLHAPTIVELFARRVEADGPRSALAIKRDGQFQWLSWNDVAADVRRLAAALVSLDVRPGDRIAHISENRYEWIVTDLSIQIARAIHVPIHPTLTGPQIAWQLRHCGCRVALLSGPHQAAKLAPLAASIGGSKVGSFTELLERGSPAEGQRLESIARDALTPQSLATILYTSGTTGEPKGVMVSQGSVLNVVADCNARFGVGPGDRFFGISAFNFDLSVYDVFGALSAGAAVVLPDPDGAGTAAPTRTTGPTSWTTTAATSPTG